MANFQLEPSKNPSPPVIPTELTFLFEEPPVLAHENPESYYALLNQIAARVNPQDSFEWIWIKDYVDIAWEILRYRRAKSQILDFGCGRALASVAESVCGETDLLGLQAEHLRSKWFANEDGKAEVKAFLTEHGLNTDSLVGQAMLARVNELEKIEAMLASAERRRDGVLREIEHHRDFSRRLLDAKAEIIDGEFTEPPLIPAGNAAASAGDPVIN
jgi:hypothetical protein